ncbi:MAG TPA: PAS domain S-box protein, partial [Kofleriaceae bacterium]|nr:PAS domain S-box protein [Kofleriaceae bacterium]
MVADVLASHLDADARLRIVSDTTRAFVEATTDLQLLLDTVVARTAEVIGDGCSILMLSEDRSLLVPAALSDRDPEVLAISRQALMEPLTVDRHPIMGGVATTGEPYLREVVDVEEMRPPRTTPGYHEFVKRIGMHSTLLVALRVHGNTIGVLALIRHRVTRTGYDYQDLAVAQVLADHAALAITNSRLYAAERSARQAAQRADIALLETERSLQRFFELSPLAQFIYDAATERVLVVNNAALELWGYTRDEFLAVRLAELRPPEPAADAAARLADIGNADVVGRRRVRRRDATLIDVELWSHVAMFEGRPARYVAVIDITDRLDLRAARASEARFRGLLEAAPDAVVIVDAGGGIVLVNGQTETLFGYQRTELIGQPVETLIPARERERHPAHRAGYVVDPQARAMGSNLELHGRRKDGTEFPVEVSLSPLETEHGVLVMSAIRDVTQRKQIGSALAAANRELEAFSYSVAHDLRAPLRGMNGFAQILFDSHKDKLDEDGLDCIREILASSQKMAALIDALLSLSRTSRSAFNARVGDLSAMVRTAAARLASSNPERSVEVVIQGGVHAEFDAQL